MRFQARHFFWVCAALGMGLIASHLRTDQIESNHTGETVIDVGDAIKVVRTVAGAPEDGGTAAEETPPRTMMIDGKPYVYIDARWYPKTTNNIYFVNGEKIYFVDGRAEPVDDGDERKPNAVQESANTEKLLKTINQNPLGAYSPENIKTMMQTLENAKAKMKERDSVLKSLSTAE